MLASGAIDADLNRVIASICTILLAPLVWAHLVIVPLIIARQYIIMPRIARMEKATSEILKNHPATKIAVAGSYGKTTMKEMLTTVLSEHLKVASTPGNKNVASAHYDFAVSLRGDEDVLIVEFGEGRPGDVERFADVIGPDIAVITGVAPAHLDQYGTVDAAARDIFSLARKVEPTDTYVNDESGPARDFITPGQLAFSRKGVDGWLVSGETIDIHGTHFTLAKGDVSINISSSLIGAHLIGVMATTAAIAHQLGISQKDIESGFSRTKPYKHRMQPYKLAGAWIIDDTYNGNIQGVKAGLELLSAVTAKRKMYVTPGLVEQGKETEKIHEEMGSTIAAANPDIVVLMKNSTTQHIRDGLQGAGFTGEVIVQSEPLKFYTNLDQFVAAGDVVLLQNDWTDNYA
jgi:UDP-N-acetylmuramoyl-tripeptide--D-alanyl-D-alanine ligase